MLYDVFCSCVGAGAYLMGTASELNFSTQGRLYGSCAAGMALGRATAAFELYNTLVCVACKEYRTVAFIGHHVVTCLLALLSMAPFVHYYSLFFLGVACFSSVPLCAIDICNHLRPHYPTFEALHGPSRSVFAILFLIIRVAIWPCVSARFWVDAVGTVREGSAHSTGAVVVFLSANIFLTGLQLMWGRKVWAGVVKALRRQKKGKGDDAKFK